MVPRSVVARSGHLLALMIMESIIALDIVLTCPHSCQNVVKIHVNFQWFYVLYAIVLGDSKSTEVEPRLVTKKKKKYNIHYVVVV